MLGPLYHFCWNFVGTAPAVAAVSTLETLVIYGSETKNAQLAYNLQQQTLPKDKQKLITRMHENPMKPFGPGVSWNLARNFIATSGLRIINEPFVAAFHGANKNLLGGSVSEGTVNFFGDMFANITAACLSMPFHQLFAYTVTSPQLWEQSNGEYFQSCKGYLNRQYFPNGKLSSVVVRDLALRSIYMAGAYTLFSTIERNFVKFWPKQDDEK